VRRCCCKAQPVRRSEVAGQHDGSAETNHPNILTPVAQARRDPFALVVRFQSIIGLVLVLIGGVVFSPTRHGQILFYLPIILPTLSERSRRLALSLWG
jgi:hypothetical protein